MPVMICPKCGGKPDGFWYGGDTHDYFVPFQEQSSMGNKSLRDDYYYGPACDACNFDPRDYSHDEIREMKKVIESKLAKVFYFRETIPQLNRGVIIDGNGDHRYSGPYEKCMAWVRKENESNNIIPRDNT